MPGELDALVAIVTGASGGIGAGIAERLAEAGAAVLVHYHRGAAAAQAVVDRITDSGGRAVPVAADLRAEPACQQLAAAALTHFGRLDVLVNNAGIQPVQDLAAMSLAEFDEVLRTNLSATFACTQAAVAVMRRAGRPGSVITIGSIEGRHPAFGHAHYAISKAAVLMHTQAAALEYGHFGIRVNAVSPGLIDRPGLAEQWPDGVRRWQRTAPLRRLGTPADIGHACVFLASARAEWITGQNLVVDGGVSAHPTW